MTFKPCDILIIRSGWTKWYESANEEEQIKGAKEGHEFVGMQGSKESVEWLWDHHFAAVAGDAIAFEAWPPKAPYSMFLCRSCFHLTPGQILIAFEGVGFADPSKQDSTTTSLPCGEPPSASSGIWKSYLSTAQRRRSTASSSLVRH